MTILETNSTKDGTGIRDYIDVEDISQIHIDALRLIKIKKSYIFNCGNSKGYSVYQIIQNFEKVIKKKFLIKIEKLDQVMFPELCNNKKLKKILNVKKKSLIKSIESAIRWKSKLI